MRVEKLIVESRSLRHLMDLLRVEGVSGHERAVASLVREKLVRAGCRASWIRHDRAHRTIDSSFEVGNLIVKIPGTLRAPRRLFLAHLDTVPLCRGARPVRRGRRIVSRDHTALGGDNRTAVACLVTLAETILAHDLPRPPLTLLFTIAEEIGLRGSRWVEAKSLGRPAMGFNIDSGAPRGIITGAVGADRWEVTIRGVSAHAGVHPEDGVSATLVAARAIADAAERGWFGRVVRGRSRGTSNVGTVQGGEATNQVTDRVQIRGESRSHDQRFLQRITAAYRQAFERAARGVKNRRGQRAEVCFDAVREYESFRMGEDAPPVQMALREARALRLSPILLVADGGLDANHLNARGIPTVTLGAGQHGGHTVNEYVDIREYQTGCRLALRIATAPEITASSRGASRSRR